MIRFLCVAPLLFWFQTAEAKKKKKAPPCWVTHPCEPYNSDEFLVGVGSGEDMSSANSAALGSIAQQFTVTVTQQQQSTKEESNTSRDQELLSQTDHQSLRTKTKVDTSTTLQNIQYVEHWTQTIKGQKPTIYALAVIHRQQWIDQLEGNRREIQSLIQQLRFQSEQSSAALQKIALLRQMVPLIEQDTALYEQQQLIGRKTMTIPPSTTVQRIAIEAERIRQEVPIGIHSDSAFGHVISKSLRANGFNVVTNTPPMLSIHCTEDLTSAEADSFGFYRIDSTINCEISDTTGKLQAVTFNASAASQNVQKAQKQVEVKITTEVTEISTTLIEWFRL